MTDVPAASLIDAILEVTPTDSGGNVPYGLVVEDGLDIWVSGDPRPVAARQAAAALRWAADNCPTVNGQTQVDGVWIWAELRELADQLDTQNSG